MADPADDKVARNRWLAINLVRLAGVALALFGIMALTGEADVSRTAGWVLLLLGLFSALLLPARLVRKWRTPRS